MKDYTHFYNNLIKLTRNKDLYREFKANDEFSDRLIFFLIHFAFFLKFSKMRKILWNYKIFMILFLDN